MKKLMSALVLVSLLVLAGCSQITYKTFSDGSFSAKYPDWPTGAGSDRVNVQKGDCQVKINIEATDFKVESLKDAVYQSIVPAIEASGVTVAASVEGDHALLKVSNDQIVAQQKYLVCDNNLYKVSAGCSTDKPLIADVINSMTCAA